MDRLAEMTCFIKTVETGSFAGAGKMLSMPPQLVGRQVAALEERLGVQLLIRTTRQHSLTEAGRTFFERAQGVVREAEEVEKAVADLGVKPRGQLVISAPYTFGSYRLAPFVADYLARHPDVRIRIVLSDSNVDVIGEGFDAALRIGPLEDSSLVARRLRPFRLMACAAPAYLDRAGSPLRPANLVEHECLIYTYWFRPPLTEWTFEKDGCAESVSVSGRMMVNDGRSVIEAALAGHGVVLQDVNILQDHVATGRLVRLFPDYVGPTRELHVIYPPSRRVSPKLRSFIDSLVERFG